MKVTLAGFLDLKIIKKAGLFGEEKSCLCFVTQIFGILISTSCPHSADFAMPSMIA